MPEYAALIYHYEIATDDGEGPPPSIEDVEAQFLVMERAGIARIH